MSKPDIQIEHWACCFWGPDGKRKTPIVVTVGASEAEVSASIGSLPDTQAQLKTLRKKQPDSVTDMVLNSNRLRYSVHPITLPPGPNFFERAGGKFTDALNGNRIIRTAKYEAMDTGEKWEAIDGFRKNNIWPLLDVWTEDRLNDAPKKTADKIRQQKRDARGVKELKTPEEALAVLQSILSDHKA